MKLGEEYMEFLTADWFGLILTGLGTLFLIGELLVNMRGLFALLGIAFMTIYFTVYLETDSFTIMIILYFLGLLLMIIDSKLINDGTLAILGIVSMLIYVGLAAHNIYAGMYAIIGVVVGGGLSFTLPKFLPSRNMWAKLTLKDRLTKEAGYSSLNVEYEKLVGERGVTLTDLRPVGTIRVNEQDYSAISNAEWIPKHSKIEIVQVDGTRILVKKITEETKTDHPPIR